MEQQIQPTLYYCYDAVCGWCYGFSPVIKRLEEEYRKRIVFDVLSGGMIMPDNAQPISVIAPYIAEAHKSVEKLTGIKFGIDFLWHIVNPEKSDWVLDSLKPAVALCIFKEYYPDKAVALAGELQYALNFEGRDLTDDEAYRHLAIKYGVTEEDFYAKLKSDEYLDKAYYEFALVKQLKVTGFPTVLLQVTDSKFYTMAQGYTDYETVKARIDKILTEVITPVSKN